MEFMQWIAGVGGIGAVFGIIMVYILLRVLKIMREDRKYWEERLSKVVDKYDETTSKNTTVLTELIIWLKAKNGGR